MGAIPFFGRVCFMLFQTEYKQGNESIKGAKGHHSDFDKHCKEQLPDQEGWRWGWGSSVKMLSS